MPSRQNNSRKQADNKLLLYSGFTALLTGSSAEDCFWCPWETFNNLPAHQEATSSPQLIPAGGSWPLLSSALKYYLKITELKSNKTKAWISLIWDKHAAEANTGTDVHRGQWATISKPHVGLHAALLLLTPLPLLVFCLFDHPCSNLRLNLLRYQIRLVTKLSRCWILILHCQTRALWVGGSWHPLMYRVKNIINQLLLTKALKIQDAWSCWVQPFEPSPHPHVMVSLSEPVLGHCRINAESVEVELLPLEKKAQVIKHNDTMVYKSYALPWTKFITFFVREWHSVERSVATCSFWLH